MKKILTIVCTMILTLSVINITDMIAIEAATENTFVVRYSDVKDKKNVDVLNSNISVTQDDNAKFNVNGISFSDENTAKTDTYIGYYVTFSEMDALYKISASNIGSPYPYENTAIYFSPNKDTKGISSSEHVNIDYDKKEIVITVDWPSYGNSRYAIEYYGNNVLTNTMIWPHFPDSIDPNIILVDDPAMLMSIYGADYDKFEFIQKVVDREAKTIKVYYGAKFTVSFEMADGTLIDTQTVVYGKGAKAPEVPTIEGKEFTGWDKDFSNVKEDLVIKAQYADITFDVTFESADGTLINTQKIVYGKGAKAPEAPIIEGKKFTGWDKEFSNVKKDMVVTAQYEDMKFNVVFKNADDTEISTQEVVYGKGAKAPEAPIIEGKKFIGWDKEFSNVKEDMVVTAQYEDITVDSETPVEPTTPVVPEIPTTPVVPEIPGIPFTPATVAIVVPQNTTPAPINTEVPVVEEEIEKANEIIEENETPLANVVDEHGNCIIHIIMLFLTILYGIYVGARLVLRKKNREKASTNNAEMKA